MEGITAQSVPPAASVWLAAGPATLSSRKSNRVIRVSADLKYAAVATSGRAEPLVSLVLKANRGREVKSTRSIPCDRSGLGIRVKAFRRIRSVVEELDVSVVQSSDPADGQGLPLSSDTESEEGLVTNVIEVSNDSVFTLELQARTVGAEANAGGFADSQTRYRPRLLWFARSEEEEKQYVDRGINATIAGAVAVFAITKILTVDQEYWRGWTVFEIVKYAPLHNWFAYEEALKDNPVLAKMMISGIVYSLGDWIAQCYEGKPILDFNRPRMLRSGLVGFCLHGSLSHFYYHLCEALFPFKDWWGVPVKVAFDQTIWSGFWNSIYFVTLGVLRFESPANIFSELSATFWPLLTAGWKLWPFAHVITYGVVPVEQRLLWVDIVELVWVTILSMYSNEKAEARILEAANEAAKDACSFETESDSTQAN